MYIIVDIKNVVLSRSEHLSFRHHMPSHTPSFKGHDVHMYRETNMQLGFFMVHAK